MTTVRKLVVELGIDGDQDVKSRLNEVQQSANSLKRTLEALETSFSGFGSQNILGGISGGISTRINPYQTSREQRASQQLEIKLREQQQIEKERADQQLSVLQESNKSIKESSNIQNNILTALRNQASSQRNIINEMIKENKEDREFLKGFLSDITSFIDPQLLAVIRQAKSAGKVGKPVSAEVRQFKEEKQATGQRIITKKKFIETGIDIGQQLDEERAEEVKMQENLVNIAQKEAQKVKENAAPKITPEEMFKQIEAMSKELEQTPEFKQLEKKAAEKKQSKITDPSQLFTYIPAAEKEEVQDITKKVQSYSPERRSRRKFDIDSIIDIDKIDDLDKQFLDIKYGTRDDLTTSEKRRVIQREVNNIIRENRKADISAEVSKETSILKEPFVKKLAVVADIMNNIEKRQIEEETEKIRSRVQPTLERQARAKERGFVFAPARRAAELIEEGRSRLLDLGEKAQSKVAGFLTSRFKQFQTPEEAAEPVTNQIAALKTGAKSFVESEEGKQVIQNIFQFNNPVIDNEERKEEITNAITLALQRLS